MNYVELVIAIDLIAQSYNMLSIVSSDFTKTILCLVNKYITEGRALNPMNPHSEHAPDNNCIMYGNLKQNI